MTETITAPANGAGPAADAFEAALAHDAQVTPPDIPAPPRTSVSADPEAPHGRGDDGEPLAPYGLNKKTGLPNRTRAGPGRPGPKDKPRVTTPPKGSGKPAAGTVTADYSADLAGLATTVWIGASAMTGGRLPVIGVKLPDLRPYAALWHDQAPQMVGAWNRAAQQSPVVRGWVEKLAGEGSWQWVIGVGVVSANLLASCTELAKAENAELRARYAEHNSQQLAGFLAQAVEQATPEAPAGDLPGSGVMHPEPAAILLGSEVPEWLDPVEFGHTVARVAADTMVDLFTKPENLTGLAGSVLLPVLVFRGRRVPFLPWLAVALAGDQLFRMGYRAHQNLGIIAAAAEAQLDVLAATVGVPGADSPDSAA